MSWQTIVTQEGPNGKTRRPSASVLGFKRGDIVKIEGRDCHGVFLPNGHFPGCTKRKIRQVRDKYSDIDVRTRLNFNCALAF
jgi:hypothetical protein